MFGNPSLSWHSAFSVCFEYLQLYRSKWFFSMQTRKFLTSGLFFCGLIAVLGFVMGAASPANPTSVSCVVELVYEFRAQDGTLLRTESYLKDFTVSTDSGFDDDYSTPTRFKEFSANLETVGRETLVNISWFSDVSTFDSIDLNTSLVLTKGQQRGRLVGNQKFSSSAGHSSVRYNLVGIRSSF